MTKPVDRNSKAYQDALSFSRRNRIQRVEFIVPEYYAAPPPVEEDVTSAPNPLQPQTFSDFVGQENAKEVLKIIVDAANKEKRLIPNILLTGAYGHGKTTLAKLVAQRHKKKIQIIDGSIAGDVIKPSSDKIYVIDEAHNIPAQVTDSFNILIDSGQLRIIACTTNPGALAAPFRSRFRSIYLEEYQSKDIAKIIEKAAKRLNVNIEAPAIDTLASRSKCNPRTALNTFDFVREMGVISGKKEITSDVIQKALNKLSIDEMGLTNLDRKYLDILRTDRPVGLQYISSILSLDVDTVQEEIEPYLLRIGLIERTPRGRILANPQYAGDDMEERLKQMLENLVNQNGL